MFKWIVLGFLSGVVIVSAYYLVINPPQHHYVISRNGSEVPEVMYR